MNPTPPAPSPAPAILTPVQVRGLKLAKEGDLFPQEGNKWTHLNATVTYAKTDRFKERPRKVRFVTTTTMDELKDFGFLRDFGTDAESRHEITMAGKIWLFKNK